MRTVALLALLCSLTAPLAAQEYFQETKKDSLVRAAALMPPAAIGIGLGLEYGGLGGCFSYAAHENIQLLLGAGYAVAGVGWNAGVQARLVPGRARPYVAGIYGTNGFIMVEGADWLNGTYLGPSVGAGFEMRNRRSHKFWRFGFWIPVRSQAFEDDMEALRNNPLIEVRQEPANVLVSVGFFWSD